MKALWYSLVFLIGGGLGFVLGGSVGGGMGMVAGGTIGTEFGVCSAVRVAEQQGILSSEPSQQLLEATAAHLRTEFKEVVERANLSEKLPLNAATCEKLMTEVKART